MEQIKFDHMVHDHVFPFDSEVEWMSFKNTVTKQTNNDTISSLLNFSLSCSLPFNHLFRLEEKGKGLEPAEINKQLIK